MKLALIVVSLACAALAAPGQYEPIGLHYHENFGIQEAARIKAAEQAADFDGNRIVGGSAAWLGQFPHLAGLIITLASGSTSVCGSTVLTNTRLLTAAHCWFDGRQNARQLTAVMGSVRLFTGGLRVVSSNVQIHANYNSNNLNNDIAVIVIPWIGFNAQINRIALAAGTNQFVGSNAVASGFGRTADNAGIGQNQQLAFVNMPVITNAQCASVYGTSAIVASTLCTSTANGRGTCQGDSGGPLQVGNALVGVTSFVAAAGCQRGLPAGFARVTFFLSWIQARM